jgi:hypothetical protein
MYFLGRLIMVGIILVEFWPKFHKAIKYQIT